MADATNILPSDCTVDQAIEIYKTMESTHATRESERDAALARYLRAVKQTEMELAIDGVSGVDVEVAIGFKDVAVSARRTNDALDALEAKELNKLRAQIVERFFSAK